MFPDMSSYSKLNRLGSHYKPSKSAMIKYIHGGREISAIIVTDDYLCYKGP